LPCPSCGTENPAGSKFCNRCGSRLAAVCPSCGTPNLADAAFCNQCGTRLSAGAAATATPAGVRPASPVAERRLVSILFADLVGFTTLAEGRDAEDTRELLSRYFDLSREIIARYGGTVEKFIGDAVMAVWGAPTAHEDDAERAVRAALELVDAVRSLGPSIQARAGVLTGEAAVTLGATNQGMVAGDLVNTASRLQSVAAPGTVLVGEATQRAASAAIAFEEAGEQTLKGKTSPVPAWRALRVVAEVGGKNRTEGLEAPFVGRDEELRLLKDLFHVTGREGRARLMSVIGPAGIGKTRLAWEFSKYLDGLVEQVWWHQGRSPAYGDGISFWALGEMVRERCGLLESDDEPTTRAKVSETLETFAPDEATRRWIEPALLALLGIGSGIAADQLFGAWRTFFERLAATAPVVMVFEDFHFADSGLIDFVDHLMEWSRNVPLYIVTLSRPELLDKRPAWGAGKRNFTSLYLEPLPETAMRQLLGGLVPGLPEPAIKAIVERADGMPLYAVETVRMLLAQGRLREEAGAFVPNGDLSSLDVPETLTALIAARLDGLDPADRALLSDAAVLGQSFTLAGLAAVSGVAEDELEPRIRPLLRREILALAVDPRSPERGQYAFVQALIREVAYNTLARKDRKVRHLAAARYFEAVGSDELAGALAGHYLAAHQNAPEGDEAAALATQARLALTAAADRAIALGAHEQAITFLDQALSVAPEPADEADLLERVAASSLSAAQYSRAETYYRRGADVSRTLGDAAAVLRTTSGVARALTSEGRPAEALDVLTAIPDEIVTSAGAAAADLYSARAAIHLRLKELQASIEWADRALELAERHELTRVVVDAVLVKANALNSLDRRFEAAILCDGVGRFADARGFTAGALDARNLFAYAVWDDHPGIAFATVRSDAELAARLGDRGRWLRALAGAGWIAISMGEWDWALREASEELTGRLEVGDRFRLERIPARLGVFTGRGPSGLDNLRTTLAGYPDASGGVWVEFIGAELDLLEGRLDDSYRAMMRVTEDAPAMAADGYPGAARAALWSGDLTGIRAALESYEGSMSHGRWPEADRFAIRGAIAALEGRRDDALDAFREAIERYRALEMPFELARVLVDMVVALGPDVPEAAGAGREAQAVLTRLGARPYLAKLETALAARVRSGASEVGLEAPRRSAGQVGVSEAR
jgi:class 3 adenylate cyclase/tetratricopeptide (TPR) repeat protein